MTREEHMNWCKARAHQYLDAGDTKNAYASMISDLSNHPETEGHAGIGLGMMMLLGGHLSSKAGMAKFIDGFN